MDYKRPSRSDFTPIKDLIRQIISRCRVIENSELCDIQQAWNRILDNEITGHAQPAALKNGSLLIHVQSPTLTHQLRFMANEIIKQINEILGDNKILELKFKIMQFQKANEARNNK